jgi:ATP-dependent RNA helicase UAP56/SUB2
MAGEEELPDFNDEDIGAGEDHKDGTKAEVTAAAIRSSGFRDFLLKTEIMQGVVECGFEQPSEVQHACIPQAVLGTDILCQAKSGMGKTAVFVLACLQLVDTSEKAVRAIVIGHTRELAYQIEHEFKRLGKHVKDMKVKAVYGGSPMTEDKEMLQKDPPHVLVGTPGRLIGLLRADGALKLDKVTHFIVDECDRCIDHLELRRDVQQVFIKTPKKKQVMMFSATLTPDTKDICKRFMHSAFEITVESEAKLTLHGLLQYYVKLEEKQKTKKLIDMLDSLEFNQVVIFVKSVKRALALDELLRDCNFPSMTLHQLPEEFHKGHAKQGEVPGKDHTRIQRLQLFKDFHKRILVTTDLFGRGMDVERLNIVINYDMPDDTMYFHRVGRCGRFGTKGLAVSFVSTDEDMATLTKVQARFDVAVKTMPAHIDTTSYLNA